MKNKCKSLYLTLWLLTSVSICPLLAQTVYPYSAITIPALGNAPGYFYVDTKIPATDWAAPQLQIDGYTYGTANKALKVTLGWYYYAGNFYWSQYHSNLTFERPSRIRLGKYTTDNVNYFIRIEISNNGTYWSNYTITSTDRSSSFLNYYQNWTYTEGEMPSSTSQITEVPLQANAIIEGNAVIKGAVGIGITAPSSPLHVFGGPQMTAGWNKTSILHATFPVQLLNSNSTKWAGIGYDFSTGMRFWINSPTDDLPSDGYNAITILNNRKIGFGTGNPKTLFHLHEQSSGDTYMHLTNESTGSTISDGLEISANGNLGANIWNYENNYLRFGTSNAEAVRIIANGNVGIGTTNPGTYKLAVEGTIGARKLKVTQGSWADDVFKTNYQLMPLSELENFIQKNNHLPGVPLEKDVKGKDLDISETQTMLLKKIEELTLYIIEVKKELKEVQKENYVMKAQLKKLENKQK